MHNPISNCCNAPIQIAGDSDEGTRYAVCTKCNKPCDFHALGIKNAGD